MTAASGDAMSRVIFGALKARLAAFVLTFAAAPA
jgi:hypothetical protein